MATARRCLISRIPLLLLTPFLLLTLAGSAAADEVSGEDVEVEASRDLAYEDRIAELERAVRVLASELERTRADVAVPEEPTLESRYGLGPAASKIYGVERGLSIGGYGEAFYRKHVTQKSSTKDRADMLRAVLYFGYKFNENIVFNSEIEFEHATTSSTDSSGGGSVSVEFAALDFMWKDWANYRAGLLLMPLGFLNLIHEPPFYYGVNRPEVEQRIIPSTWRSNGAGLFGNFGEEVDYQLYVVTSLNGKGFDPSGVRGGRQKGNRALAESLGFTGRLDWTPAPGLLLGASFFTGKSGQNQTFASASMAGMSVRLPDAQTTIWDVHAQYDWRDLHLRGLFTMAHVDDATGLTLALRDVSSGSSTVLGASEAIADSMLGGYVEIAYDIGRWLGLGEGERRLEPFYRYEYLDTQWDMPSGFPADESKKIQVHTVGVQYEPIPRVVLKFDYRNRQAEKGAIADELNFGVGYVF